MAKLRQVFTKTGAGDMIGEKGVLSMAQKIYLADDEKNILQLIAAFLSQEGFEVETFESGDALLSACHAGLPDLVILDIMMPGTDGLSVCSALRKVSAWLPIIIVSAKDSPYDRVTGLTLGSDDYLVKPFLPLELVARVRTLLRRAQNTAPAPEGPQELSCGALRLFPERRERQSPVRVETVWGFGFRISMEAEA